MTDRDQRLPETTHLARTALRVNDFRGVGEFYADVVGLDVLDRTETSATLGADGVPLLELTADEDAPVRGQNEAGLFHTAFRVPSRDALGDAIRRVRTLWELDGASDHDVSEAIYFSDPEGNGIEIYRDRPRSAWPTDDDGRVRMDTRPLDIDEIETTGEWQRDVPPGTDIGHVHLEVTSLERARAFYVDTLGLAVRQEFPEMGLFLAADDYHHHVGLNTWNGRSEPVGGRGIDWVEFVVPDRTVVDALGERLQTDDIDVSERSGGLEIQDPDGIGIRVRPEPGGGAKR